MVGGTSQLLTVDQAALQLQLPRSSMYRLIAAGAIEHVRVSPKVIRLRPQALDRFVQQQTKRAVVSAARESSPLLP